MNCRKKILFVATEYAPGMIPFAATIIKTLAGSKIFDIHAVVVSSGTKTYKLVLENLKQVTFIEYPESKLKKIVYKFYPRAIIKKIENLDQQYQFDAIHLLTGDFSLALYLKIKGVDKRFFYTVHDLFPHEVSFKSIKDRFIHKCIVSGYKTCRDVINNLTTSSEQQMRDLCELYNEKKIQFTPFPTLVTPTIRQGDVIPPEICMLKDYILFFGSVNVYKGVDLLLDLFKDNEETFRDVKLVVAGKGLNMDCGNPKIIRINRFIDDSEVRELFRRAKFVVYPYRTATMSGVFSLAFYFKKKILASSIPFFKQYQCANIMYFEDFSDLKNKMQEMLLDYQWNNEDDSYGRFYGEDEMIAYYKKLYFS